MVNLKIRLILIIVGAWYKMYLILKCQTIYFIITTIKRVIKLNLSDLNLGGLFYIFIIKTILVFYYQFVVLNKICTDDIFPRGV